VYERVTIDLIDMIDVSSHIATDRLNTVNILYTHRYEKEFSFELELCCIWWRIYVLVSNSATWLLYVTIVDNSQWYHAV